VLCPVEVADTVLQQGQGMHGSFSRADTWNFMAMQGPDFKQQFVDPAPVSNADVGRTIAYLMQLDTVDKGNLVGRVLSETLPNGALPEVSSRVIMSDPAPNGLTTVINMQLVGSTRYFDAAGFPERTIGLSTTFYSRSGNDLTERFPLIVEALAKLRPTATAFIFDCEQF
jgi:hypothetical protein